MLVGRKRRLCNICKYHKASPFMKCLLYKKRMSIQFKAYNEKEYSSVNIPGSHISCLKLKELLINKLRIGMKSDFRFTLLDEEGKKGAFYMVVVTQ